MAGRTIQNLPFALPVADPFTMGSVDPVPGLVDMALTADHVSIIVINLIPFQSDKAARDIFIVTGHAPEFALAMQAMFQLEVVMWLF